MARQAKAMVECHHGGSESRATAVTRAGIGLQEAETMILAELDKTIGELHWVGHAVIYSSLSLLALHELRGWGSYEDIVGISELIHSFERTIPGRSWIGYSASEVKRLQIEEATRSPRFTIQISYPSSFSGSLLPSKRYTELKRIMIY